MTATAPSLECRAEGKIYKIADTTFISNHGIYSCRMDDYTLLTDFDCTRWLNCMPKSLKLELHSRWRYSMHVSHGMALSVNRNLLYARVIGGEILGYKFMECSIDGNECAYYGVIPTQHKHAGLEDWHRRCRFTMMSVFPRRLYVYLERSKNCICGEDECVMLQTVDLSGTHKIKFCIKEIPWSRIYVMMGELDDTCVEQVKETRDCKICAQCYNCSKSVQFCRNHRVCKHKSSRSATTSKATSKTNIVAADITIPRIKDCKRVKK